MRPHSAQADVHRRLHLAPERAVARLRAVEVLDDDDRRARAGIDVAVVVVLHRALLGGAAAAAAAPSGSLPCARSRRPASAPEIRTGMARSCSRGLASCGSSRSSALQIVGVSNAASAARSACERVSAHLLPPLLGATALRRVRVRAQRPALRFGQCATSGGRTFRHPGSPVRSATMLLKPARNGCVERDLDERGDARLVVGRHGRAQSRARTRSG